LISQIGLGFVVYFGVAEGDAKEKADFLAKKIGGLRVFEDENGKMNLGLKDVGGSVLFVSQFTLIADVLKGNRPSFSSAMRPDGAIDKPLELVATNKWTLEQIDDRINSRIGDEGEKNNIDIAGDIYCNRIFADVDLGVLEDGIMN
jgi:D-Tyr-tRNAtyr deacylase